MALQRHGPAHRALRREQLQDQPWGEPLQRQRPWRRVAKEMSLQRYRPKHRRQQLPAKEIALQRRQPLLLLLPSRPVPLQQMQHRWHQKSVPQGRLLRSQGELLEAQPERLVESRRKRRA